MEFPNGEAHTGTGTLIDRRHVLTAAHNVFGNDIGGWATTAHFSPARNGGRFPHGKVAAPGAFITDDDKTLSPPDPNRTRDGGVDDYTVYTEDHAVARLAEPADLPFMGILEASNRQLAGSTARITGYPGDKPDGTMWTDAVPLAEPDEHFLFYKINTWKGQSSAGPFADLEMPYGKSIVGLHVAGVKILGTNSAVRLTAHEVNQVKAWMRAG